MDDTLQITPEQAELLDRTIEILTEALDAVVAVIKHIVNVFSEWFDNLVESLAPPRIKWLANNHHKQRVRKKNRHRMYALFRKILDSGVNS